MGARSVARLTYNAKELRRLCRGTVNWQDVYIIKQENIPRKTLERLNERWIRGHGGIPVDLCIGPEIENLITNGVVTVGSCCGHGKWNAHALAFSSEKEKVEALGYESSSTDGGWIVFELKTGTKFNTHSDN